MSVGRSLIVGKGMPISRSQVECFLLIILLSISGLNHAVLGARAVKEELESQAAVLWRKSLSSTETDGAGSFATGDNRQVPSTPDPIHNR